MKPKSTMVRVLPIVFGASAWPAYADVIYSGIRDIGIPANQTGVYLNVLSGQNGAQFTGWHINPFFGGIGVANNSDFQPVRQSAGDEGTLSNLPVHSLVGMSSIYDPTNSMGGSIDHMGTTYTAGQQGYLGFKVVNGAETNFGWMRVIFTGTGNPVINDWAYNTGGGEIGVGNIIQNGSTFTLDSTAQSFTLASAIAGSHNVVKNGANTVILSGAHGYAGTTTINTGTLALASGANIANSSIITVGNGATFDVGAVAGGWTLGAAQTLTGSGGVTGNTTIAGTHNAGTNGVGAQTFAGNLGYATGSVFKWDINANDTTGGFDTVAISGNLDVAEGTLFHVKFGSSVDLDNAFWKTNQTWQNLFSFTTGSGWLSNTAITAFDSTNNEINLTGIGSFSISGGTLAWTAVPEPSGTFAALLLGFGALRRRRS